MIWYQEKDGYLLKLLALSDELSTVVITVLYSLWLCHNLGLNINEPPFVYVMK